MGHLSVATLTNGAVDRVVVSWIGDGVGKSSVKNSLAVLVRVMEQAVRDGLRETNPARVRGWQKLYQQIEDELDDLRALALPNWTALTTLADALVQRSADRYRGWGDVVIFAACTASRIGEVSGCRVGDIDTDTWTWRVRRQTTPSPGGMEDKGTKGNRARPVPLIEEVRQLVSDRLDAVGRDKPDARLFRGPRGGVHDLTRNNYNIGVLWLHVHRNPVHLLQTQCSDPPPDTSANHSIGPDHRKVIPGPITHVQVQGLVEVGLLAGCARCEAGARSASTCSVRPSTVVSNPSVPPGSAYSAAPAQPLQAPGLNTPAGQPGMTPTQQEPSPPHPGCWTRPKRYRCPRPPAAGRSTGCPISPAPARSPTAGPRSTSGPAPPARSPDPWTPSAVPPAPTATSTGASAAVAGTGPASIPVPGAGGVYQRGHLWPNRYGAPGDVPQFLAPELGATNTGAMRVYERHVG